MAETWTRAFGRYLRTIRERRGLSLEDVASLSQAFADTLNKGYLSRCENGHQRLAFSKVIPLSRICEVPADILVERMELDMELDRVGGPETEGKSFAELFAAGTGSFGDGNQWMAYGYLRDATCRAAADPVHSHFRDREEQIARSHVNCATAAVGLGRYRYSLHEFSYALRSEKVGLSFFPIILERISTVYRKLDQRDKAKEFAEAAIKAEQQAPDHAYRGYLYSNRGLLTMEAGDLITAARDFQTAFQIYKEQGLMVEAARCLNNLGQVYFDMKRYGAARRALSAGQKVEPQNLRLRTLAHVLLGEIDEIEGHDRSARKHWQEAATIAKQLKDKVLRFKAEFFLLRQARRGGDEAIARAISRRLRKLRHWIPQTTPELAAFLEIDQDNLPPPS